MGRGSRSSALYVLPVVSVSRGRRRGGMIRRVLTAVRGTPGRGDRRSRASEGLVTAQLDAMRVWTSRSRMASAMVASPSASCQCFTGIWLVMMVERRWVRSSMTSSRSADCWPDSGCIAKSSRTRTPMRAQPASSLGMRPSTRRRRARRPCEGSACRARCGLCGWRPRRVRIRCRSSEAQWRR